jgi:serine O-acetyltransferase
MLESPVPLYRIYHRLYLRGVPKLPWWLYHLHRIVFSCEIHPAAVLGPGCLIPHSVGLVIGPEVRVGRGCYIGQNVTLGYRYPGPRDPRPGDGNPILGDHVTIGAGAVVLGRVTIGDGAIVGANSVVTRDVPPHHLAAGVPAAIRPRRT